MKNLLKKIIEDQVICAKFFNTLSLLEYIGARKILKSQDQQTINAKVLAHVSEELRHAQVLKKIALKNAPEVCQTYASECLFCGEAAVQYFQTIDKAVEVSLGESNRWHAYLLTTQLIELRATSFYKEFESVLQSVGQTVFRGILLEEEKHLDDVISWSNVIPNGEVKIATLKAMEAQAFKALVETFEKALKVEVVS